MDIDIRNHIKNNFKDTNQKEIEGSIENSIKENDEVTLPGLGVFFEILWKNSDENTKQKILDTINNNI